MDLLLWRHAEAEDTPVDLARKLTKKGHNQAKIMGSWIKQHFPHNYQLWVSEALRAQQTAATLATNTTILPELNPNTKSELVIQTIFNTHLKNNLIIVGHQPWIGHVCAQLILGQQTNLTDNINTPYWSFKKAAIWWLELKLIGTDDFYHCKVKAVLNPALLT